MAAGEFRNYIVASSGAGWHAQCNVQRDLTEQEIADGKASPHGVDGLPSLDAATQLAENWEAQVTA